MKRTLPESFCASKHPKKERTTRSSFITRHFVRFQNNAIPPRHYRDPLLVIESTASTQVTKDCYNDILRVSATFPWKKELEKKNDPSKIKSLELVPVVEIHDVETCRGGGCAICYGSPGTKKNTHARISEYIKRMKILDELAVHFHTPNVPEGTKSHLFAIIISSLKDANIRLKKLKIRRLCFTWDSMMLLSSYLSEITSLDVLEIEGCTEKMEEDCKPLKTIFRTLMGSVSLKTLALTDFTLPSDNDHYWWKFLEKTTSLEQLRLDSRYELRSVKQLMEYAEKHPRLTETALPGTCLYFIDGEYPNQGHEPAYAIPCPKQLAWHHANAYSQVTGEMKITVETFVSCIESCNLINIQVVGKLSLTERTKLLAVLKKTNIESLSLERSNITVPEIITLLTDNKTLKELNLRGNAINNRDFMQLVPYLSQNDALTSVDMSSNMISLREMYEIMGLCQIIENNSRLNYLNLVASVDHNYKRFFQKNDEEIELLVEAIIKSTKKNCVMWQCRADLSGSTSFFFIFRV